MQNFQKQIPLFKVMTYMQYTVKSIKGLTMGNEIYFQKNELEIENDPTGFSDEPITSDYVDYKYMNGFSFWKPYGVDPMKSKKGEHTEMLMYFNFIMIREGLLTQRVRYSIIEILG